MPPYRDRNHDGTSIDHRPIIIAHHLKLRRVYSNIRHPILNFVMFQYFCSAGEREGCWEWRSMGDKDCRVSQLAEPLTLLKIIKNASLETFSLLMLQGKIRSYSNRWCYSFCTVTVYLLVRFVPKLNRFELFPVLYDLTLNGSTFSYSH